jgi:hypothetical protein
MALAPKAGLALQTFLNTFYSVLIYNTEGHTYLGHRSMNFCDYTLV